MKLLIASDIHGNFHNTLHLINLFHELHADKLIILGDIYHGYSYQEDHDIQNILSTIREHLVLIRGNCDSDMDDELSPVGLLYQYSIKLGHRTIYFNHGHRGMINTEYKPGDIYCHGHTHINSIDLYHHIIICNPGSVTFPRGSSQASYMVIDDNGIYIFNFKNDIIKQYLFEVPYEN